MTPPTPDPALEDAVATALAADLGTDEQVRLLTGGSMFTLRGEPRIGLAELAFSDGPTGVRGLRFTGGPQACLLPNATLLAATWDEELLTAVGELLGEEAARQRIHVVLGPTVNLHRSPLGGRLFEAFSEDPLLTGRLAAAYVRGLQGRGVGACPKHLVANESETDRHTVDSRVAEATLRELYLLPFQIALEDSAPWTVMAAYNLVNGVPATEQDDVVNGVLKGEWGFDGLVMSDWFATESAAPAANGGLDLVMPGPGGPWDDGLAAAVEAGEVSREVLDDHLRRLLRLAARVGGLEGAPGGLRRWPTGLPEPDDDARRAALTRWAAAGSVLLVNRDRTAGDTPSGPVLPLADGARIALIGRPGTDTALMGGGSAQVNPPHLVTIAEGLAAAAPGRVTVVDGVEVRTRAVPARPGVVLDPDGDLPGMHVVVTGEDGAVLADEHVGAARRLVGLDDALPAPAASARLSARVELTGRVTVGVIGLGRWVLTLGEQRWETELRPTSGDPGEHVIDPPAWTVEAELDAPAVLTAEVDLREGPRAMLGLVARPAPRPDDEAVAAAVEAARACDVAVVVVGLTEEQETEGRDKTTLALPGAQDALVEAVAAAAPRTVVVVNAATPVLAPWAERVDALLVAGLPGQEGGAAVAAVLTGELEPAGRLTTSWPVADGASPAWSVTPVDGVLEYAEGPFVGYRGHLAGRAPDPRFWFGEGLGWGTWGYGEGRVGGPAEAPEVTVPVTNTGPRRSREVVQVYLRPGDPDQPVRLAGWAAAEVDPGATAEVTVRCDARALRRWDTAAGGWVPVGDGELLVARGPGDVRLALPYRPAELPG